MAKMKQLQEYIEKLTHTDIIVAFSGGVDSSLLLKLCCQAALKTGVTVYAVTAHTRLHPVKDLAISKKLASEMGAHHIILTIDELEEAGIADNPVDRCYHCKKFLFQKMIRLQAEVHAGCIIEGTNEDDLHVYRPGLKALEELGIISPLADLDITKAEVRQMAALLNISVADRPSTPCMATRFPYGAKLSYEMMRKAEEGEEWIRSQGFYNVRVRVYNKLARIEVDKKDIPKLFAIQDALTNMLYSIGFSAVEIDPKGFRSGSMDENL